MYTLGTGKACIESYWLLRVNSQRVNTVDGQTLTSRAPCLAAVGALKDGTPISACVEGAWGLSVNRYRRGPDAARTLPSLTTIDASKHPAVVAQIDGSRSLRINGYGEDFGIGQAGVNGTPATSPVGSFEQFARRWNAFAPPKAAVGNPRVESSRRLRVNGQSGYGPAFR